MIVIQQAVVKNVIHFYPLLVFFRKDLQIYYMAENINNIQEQDREKLFKENHKHRFQFSHTTMEARNEIYGNTNNESD